MYLKLLRTSRGGDLAHTIKRQRMMSLKTLEFEGDIEIIDPKEEEENERRSRYAAFWKAQQRKGRTLYDAERLMRNEIISFHDGRNWRG